jgi:ribosome-interacting GTPase 1
MKFDDLTEENFLMFSMREYNNMQCTDIEEFYDDLKKVKYIKRLFNIYKNDGQLKERLILNHLITWYNVFPVQAGTRILFYKIEEHFWPMLKTFLIFLDRMPDKIEMIRGKEIKSTDIILDEGIVTRLRTIKV